MNWIINRHHRFFVIQKKYFDRLTIINNNFVIFFFIKIKIFKSLSKLDFDFELNLQFISDAF